MSALNRLIILPMLMFAFQSCSDVNFELMKQPDRPKQVDPDKNGGDPDGLVDPDNGGSTPPGGGGTNPPDGGGTNPPDGAGTNPPGGGGTNPPGGGGTTPPDGGGTNPPGGGGTNPPGGGGTNPPGGGGTNPPGGGGTNPPGGGGTNPPGGGGTTPPDGGGTNPPGGGGTNPPGGGGTNPPGGGGTNPPDVIDNPGNKEASQRFEVPANIRTTRSPIDVIWIVDNSGSMTEEALWVENNVEAFAKYLATNADARLTLVTSRSVGNYIRLSTENEQIAHVDQEIKSRDGLNILLKLFNETALRDSPKFISRWRENVPKAIVMVTDDNAKLSAAAFRSQLPAKYAKDLKYFNSIVGFPGNESPCKYNAGSVYLDLSQQISGKTFDICTADWSPIFADLAISIEDKFSEPSQTRFQLIKRDIESIISVTINGAEVHSSDYAEIGGYLSISKDAFPPSGQSYEVIIDYYYN